MSEIVPTYYVKHPDGTYSMADPQPAAAPLAEPQGAQTDEAIDKLAHEAIGFDGELQEVNAHDLRHFARTVLAAVPSAPRGEPLTRQWIDTLSQQNGWDGGAGAPEWLVELVRDVERAHGIGTNSGEAS